MHINPSDNGVASCPTPPFSTILAKVGGKSEETRLQLSADGMQGRAGYGGLVGALALTSMRSHVPPARKIRSLLISFVGPVGPEDFSIHPRVLRSGKAVTHVEVKLVQQEAVRCVVLGYPGKSMPECQLLKHLRKARAQ